MMKLLKQMKNVFKKKIAKIKGSLIYKVSKQNIEILKLRNQIQNIKSKNIIKERKYIDKINVQMYEIRYIDLQMARIMKYINSLSFEKNTNKEIKEHLIQLIKGNMLD